MRDSPVSKISLCSYFNILCIYMDKQAAWLLRSCSKEARSRLPGYNFLHINTYERSSLFARMKVLM